MPVEGRLRLATDGLRCANYLGLDWRSLYCRIFQQRECQLPLDWGRRLVSPEKTLCFQEQLEGIPRKLAELPSPSKQLGLVLGHVSSLPCNEFPQHKVPSIVEVRCLRSLMFCDSGQHAGTYALADQPVQTREFRECQVAPGGKSQTCHPPEVPCRPCFELLSYCTCVVRSLPACRTLGHPQWRKGGRLGPEMSTAIIGSPPSAHRSHSPAEINLGKYYNETQHVATARVHQAQNACPNESGFPRGEVAMLSSFAMCQPAKLLANSHTKTRSHIV